MQRGGSTRTIASASRQPTPPSSLHTCGCSAQVLDDFNLQHEHVSKMHEFSYLTVMFFQETSLISQAVRMCARIVHLCYLLQSAIASSTTGILVDNCLHCTSAN